MIKPVEFVQRIEKGSGEKNKAFVLPSPDFQRLCVEQLDLFRRIFNPDAVLSSKMLSVHMRSEVGMVMAMKDPSGVTFGPFCELSFFLLIMEARCVRRLCEVFDVLEAWVVAIKPLANKQQRSVELCDLSRSSQVAVDEPALRQALSNLIEGSLLRTEIEGKVEFMSTETPAGVLIIIDDDGLDMHYMMHSLAPFGADLLAGDRIGDNMSWNFIAGLTVAREILESYGCVVHVISPRNVETPVGAGGTRIELWLPLSPPTSSDRWFDSGCLKSK